MGTEWGGYNSKGRIVAWGEAMALDAVRDRRITQKDYDIIVAFVETEAERGQWRGDISEGLVRMGYDWPKLRDLYK